MDDLISRQAAIDAIKTWGLIDGLSEGQAIEILADEEKVPSVQPEIIRCKDCVNAPKCFGDVVMKTRSGGNLYCPLTFCSEGKRKDE